MRPTSLQDALWWAKPLAKDLSKRYESNFDNGDQPNRWPQFNPPTQKHGQTQPQTFPCAYTITSRLGYTCFECNKLGHFKNERPRLLSRNNQDGGREIKEQNFTTQPVLGRSCGTTEREGTSNMNVVRGEPILATKEWQWEHIHVAVEYQDSSQQFRENQA